MVDIHSNFIEVDQFTTPTSDAVTECLKTHFACCGIPDILTSDNGTQFTSHLFRKFTKKWMFEHKTISSGNIQVNGAAEAAKL